MSLLLTPNSSEVPENAQQQAVRVQVLLAMGQYLLSKDEAGNILDQQVHMVAMTQELRHSTQNFVRLTEDYLGTEGPLSRAMATYPRHICRSERQYDKVFAGHCLFGTDIVDRIHK